MSESSLGSDGSSSDYVSDNEEDKKQEPDKVQKRHKKADTSGIVKLTPSVPNEIDKDEEEKKRLKKERKEKRRAERAERKEKKRAKKKSM